VQTITEGQFSFRYSPTFADIEWSVETSTDLVSWNEVARVRAAGLPHDVESGYTLNVVEGPQDMMTLSLDPLTGESRVFVRIKVISLVN